MSEQRSLIDLARRTALSVNAPDLANSPEHARYFVAGYDLGVASVQRENAEDADQYDPLNLADDLRDARIRINELETALEKQIKYSVALQRLIESLQAGHLANVSSVAPHHYNLAAGILKKIKTAQTPAAPVVGVVVTEEMVHRAWRHLPFAKEQTVREILTAALTTATTVPLASEKPVWWEDAYGCMHRDESYARVEGAVTPLYRGVAQPARGEA